MEEGRTRRLDLGLEGIKHILDSFRLSSFNEGQQLYNCEWFKVLWSLKVLALAKVCAWRQ